MDFFRKCGNRKGNGIGEKMKAPMWVHTQSAHLWPCDKGIKKANFFPHGHRGVFVKVLLELRKGIARGSLERGLQPEEEKEGGRQGGIKTDQKTSIVVVQAISPIWIQSLQTM